VKADPHFEAAIVGQSGIAFYHSLLDFEGAAQRVDGAAKFNKNSITGALEDPAVVDGNGRISQVAA